MSNDDPHGELDFSVFDPNRFRNPPPKESQHVTPVKKVEPKHELDPACSSCATNEFSIIKIKPANGSRAVEVLACNKCGTVHGVVNDISQLESAIEDLSSTINRLKKALP